MGELHPQAILIAGPNGAGKSTLAPVLLSRYGPPEFVNADTIAHELSAARPDAVAFEAGRIMLKRLRALSAGRESFAFESTLASRSYAPWLSGLRRASYEFHLIYVWLRSPDLALQRVRERVRVGGHDIPEGVIRRRYYGGWRNFFSLYRRLADAWVIYDNSLAAAPVVVASGSGDVIHQVFESAVWEQFRESMNEGRA